MPRQRLRNKAGKPVLGWNLHVQKGHERLTFVMKNYTPGKILDVGCGEGGFSKSLCDNDARNKVWAIDILDSPPMREDKRIHFEVMDVYALHKDYGIAPYDTILFMEIIEHLEHPDIALETLDSLLAWNGKILITTPHIPNWDNEQDHIWRFDEDSLRDVLKPYTYHMHKDDTFLYAVIHNILRER